MRPSRACLVIAAIIFAAFVLFVLVFVRFNIKGHFEGLYFLRDKSAGQYELADHLFVGESRRLLCGINLEGGRFRFIRNLLYGNRENQPHLHCEWNPKDGSGMVSSYLADGSELVTYFGRYLDDDDEVHGLFVGGGLPETVSHDMNYNMNNSGMTYGDGKRWYHIWCSVNEGISPLGAKKVLTPAHWEFLDSRVISRNTKNVAITSSHMVMLDHIPVRIDRRVNFNAGETYFTLEIKIENKGNAPVSYIYDYGDEPWVGYYGTSLGDVGWVKDRLINYEEEIDSRKYSYAGIADVGNRVIGEQPVYTNLANFIEWFGVELPIVYFVNTQGDTPKPGARIPLQSNERFIGLQWQRSLLPGETSTIRLAIGMAQYNPATGIPVKPYTTWK